MVIQLDLMLCVCACVCVLGRVVISGVGQKKKKERGKKAEHGGHQENMLLVLL